MTAAARAALVALLATGCSKDHAAPRAEAPPPRAEGVLLVSIDTLRADHVGATRAGVPLTPSLDALALDGLAFTDAIANCTVTRSSHASMLTGLYPWRHGIPDNSGTLRPDVATLPERLRSAGIATGAVVSSFPMRELSRGFDTFDQAYDGVQPGRPNEPVASPKAATGAAIQWLRAQRLQRFFLLVHYFPPHGPYVPPPRFQLSALEAPSGRILPLSRKNYEHGAIPAYQKLGDIRDPAVYRARYAAYVRYVDEHVGRLLQELRALNLYDRTAVLVTSDHGESLGERDWHFCHGNLTYREQSAVPLIFKLPGQARAGKRVDAPVQGVDLFPTVLELFDLPVPQALDGQSLLAAREAGADRERLRFTQSNDAEQLSVLSGPWKFTRVAERALYIEASHPRRALYRLDRDPAESRNLLDEAPRVAGTLEEVLRRQFIPFAPSKPLDRETEERLRALGYVR